MAKTYDAAEGGFLFSVHCPVASVLCVEYLVLQLRPRRSDNREIAASVLTPAFLRLG